MTNVAARRRYVTRRAPQTGCNIEDCDRSHHARGLCQVHYEQLVFDSSSRSIDTPRRRKIPARDFMVCVCDGDTVKCHYMGFGAIVCRRCGRPPMESFGIWWTPDILAAVRAAPDTIDQYRR